MNKEVLISVIIPCYNAAPYVGEAIQSALDQTYRNTEVIVINDGSTDGSLEVIRSFGDAIRWETGPNRGGCAARNRGIELASGEFIQFLDADDLLHSDKLAKQVRVAEREPHKLIYCDWQTVTDGSADTAVYSYESRGLDPLSLNTRHSLQTSTPLHRRSTLMAVGGFRAGLPCAQERDLHIRLAAHDIEFLHLPEVLCTVRSRPGTVSSDVIRLLDQHLEIVQVAHHILLDRGKLTDRRARALAGFLASDARWYLRFGLPAKARLYCNRARQIHPDGGITEAYGNPLRLLRRCCGPEVTEIVAGFARRFRS